MNLEHLLPGTLMTLLVFGGYFVRGNGRQAVLFNWREFLARCVNQISRRELLWSVTLPALWLILFYTLAAHVWLSLGRWPEFGEPVDGWGWLVKFHHATVWLLAGALLASLYPTALLAVVCLFLPRWRRVTVYALSYAAAVGIVFGAMLLAPGPFLNWLFD